MKAVNNQETLIGENSDDPASMKIIIFSGASSLAVFSYTLQESLSLSSFEFPSHS